LTSAAYGVPVTITPSHTTSLSSGGTGCAKERPSAADRDTRRLSVELLGMWAIEARWSRSSPVTCEANSLA
jgi:hypothetical protein